MLDWYKVRWWDVRYFFFFVIKTRTLEIHVGGKGFTVFSFSPNGALLVGAFGIEPSLAVRGCWAFVFVGYYYITSIHRFPYQCTTFFIKNNNPVSS